MDDGGPALVSERSQGGRRSSTVNRRRTHSISEASPHGRLERRPTLVKRRHKAVMAPGPALLAARRSTCGSSLHHAGGKKAVRRSWAPRTVSLPRQTVAGKHFILLTYATHLW